MNIVCCPLLVESSIKNISSTEQTLLIFLCWREQGTSWFAPSLTFFFLNRFGAFSTACKTGYTCSLMWFCMRAHRVSLKLTGRVCSIAEAYLMRECLLTKLKHREALCIFAHPRCILGNWFSISNTVTLKCHGLSICGSRPLVLTGSCSILTLCFGVTVLNIVVLTHVFVLIPASFVLIPTRFIFK